MDVKTMVFNVIDISGKGKQTVWSRLTTDLALTDRQIAKDLFNAWLVAENISAFDSTLDNLIDSLQNNGYACALEHYKFELQEVK